MMNAEDDIVQYYVEESCGHLATIETDLLALELEGDAFDELRMNRILSALHSIKSGAGSLELAPIRELAHRTEHVAALIRSRQIVPTGGRIGVLLSAVDKLGDLLQDDQDGGQDISALVASLAAISLEDGASPRNPNALRQVPPAAGKLRALLVEDDFASRLVLQTFLSRYGECHVAVNGREAVAACRAALEAGESYHLICMDIMMPEMDGRQAVQEIREMEEAQGILSTSGAKIIMTTAVDNLKDVARCYRALCDAYVVKPIDLTRLLSQMRSYELAP